MIEDTFQDIPPVERLANELQEAKAKLALLTEARFYMLARIRELEGRLRETPSKWPNPIGMN